MSLLDVRLGLGGILAKVKKVFKLNGGNFTLQSQVEIRSSMYYIIRSSSNIEKHSGTVLENNPLWFPVTYV